MHIKINANLVPEAIRQEVEILICERWPDCQIDWEPHEGHVFVLSMPVDHVSEDNDGFILSLEQKVSNFVFKKTQW